MSCQSVGDKESLSPGPRWLRKAFRRSLSALSPSMRDRVFAVTSQYATPLGMHRLGLSCMEGALEVAKANGFQPSAVVDIGACFGEWSHLARRVFPSVPVVMIDGNPESEEPLRLAVQALGGDCKYVVRLLGAKPNEKVTLFQNGKGTSVLPELTSFKTQQAEVPMYTLDSLLESEHLKGPLLLKLDVQGFELEVLRGAARTLQDSELVMLEIATLPYNRDAPLFSEVIAFMESAGYVVLDICEQLRRQTDGAPFQVDVLFARATSDLRKKRKFWLNEP